MPFRLATVAAGDLEGIRALTLERWGRAQWLAYRGALARTFERIAAELGGRAATGRLSAGMRSVPCRAHVVFYLELGGGMIGIVRVLHARQNAAALRWEEGWGDGGCEHPPYLLIEEGSVSARCWPSSMKVVLPMQISIMPAMPIALW